MAVVIGGGTTRFIMKNYRRTIAKLQKALLLQGRQIRMSTRQFYSEEQNRLIDFYTLTEGKNDVLKTASLPEVMKFLAAEYQKGRDDGSDN